MSTISMEDDEEGGGNNNDKMCALSEVVKSWKESCCLKPKQQLLVEEDENTTTKVVKTNQELESDAKIFFKYISRSTTVETTSNVKLETKSSHEEALSKVIQELRPAFTSNHYQCRLRGLHVLSGAIHGCVDGKAIISNKTLELLGTFLLGHCGPIDVDDNDDGDDDIDDEDEDYDSMIRDTAVIALGYLIQTVGGGGGEEKEERIENAISMRLQFSRQGIERRCAIPEEDDDVDMMMGGVSAYDDPNRSNNIRQDIRGGLSTLTRTKRSTCFTLLQRAVSGVNTISEQQLIVAEQQHDQAPLTENVVFKIRLHLAEFAAFASNCILGESDPRCLLQLLHIFHEMQLAFTPWFTNGQSSFNKTAGGNSTKKDGGAAFFPVEDIFDAASPYFPIQFTPPPNDIHGITREGLHQALIDVLNYTKMDEYASSNNKPSMLSLSVGLYLEQMMPMGGAEESGVTIVERQEALDCLSSLLFPTENESLCSILDVQTTRNLAVALETTHAEASMAVANGVQRDQSKALADACRTLVSKIAFHLEIVPNTALFDAFVSEPLQKQTRKIRLSPSRSKTSIAYIACLSASGRSRTLRLCLSTGLEPLLENLNEGLDDEEEVAAAAHGIAAFFSSCRVAVERASERGVALNNHPLDDYTPRACKLLLGAFEDDDLSESAKIGVVRALECLFISCQKIDLEIEDVARICRFIEGILSVTLGRDPQKEDQSDVDWRLTCSLALGNIVGTALDSRTGETADNSSTFLSNARINDCIQKEVYPTMLKSALRADKNKDNFDRLDRRALATACNVSLSTATSIIVKIVEDMNSALKEDFFNPSCVTSAESLSYMLRNGGDKCTRAYHDNPGSDALLTTIGQSSGKRGELGIRLKVRSSVSNLALPATDEEMELIQSEIDTVYKIVACLLPAYKQFVPQTCLDKFLSSVYKLMPPLSQEDTYGLCVRLPILATILKGYAEAGTALDTSLEDMSAQLLPGLTYFALSSDYDSRARSAAASCLHELATLVPSNKECPVRPLVTERICPAMSPSAEVGAVYDCLQISAVLGSAAATRAGSSSSTAAEIARFLVDLACKHKSFFPFSKEDEAQLSNWAKPSGSEASLEMTAASAFGSMLTGKLRPVVRQRLNHIGLQYIRAEYEIEGKQAAAGVAVKAPPLGLIVVVCHIICWSDLTKMDKTMLHQMIVLSLEGLGSCNLLPREAKVLLLSSILKLISFVPSSMSGYLLTVVSGLLRAYAVSDPSSEVGAKLIALQALEAMATIEGAKMSAPNIKPAVVAILRAALDHPNGLLRQAAVDVQNAWHVL